jgi:hypothetical protein
MISIGAPLKRIHVDHDLGRLVKHVAERGCEDLKLSKEEIGSRGCRRRRVSFIDLPVRDDGPESAGDVDGP